MTTPPEVPMPEPEYSLLPSGFITARKSMLVPLTANFYTAEQVRDTAIKYADARCAVLQAKIEDHAKLAIAAAADLSTQRDALIAEVADLQAERDALAEKVKALDDIRTRMEDNDRRYRWLRDQSNFANRHAPAVVSSPIDDDLKRILVDSELDAAIDAAGSDQT